MVDDVLARSFEGIGADYDRYRPGFPSAAAELIFPARVARALDLGAGTGKFTRLLRDRADAVVAVEPSEAMLDVLRAQMPDVDARQGGAEQIPLEDASVDAVSVAQAFHWFDRDRASREIARVLRRGGVLGLVWNHSDPSCAWDSAAHAVAHPAVSERDGQDRDATTSSADADLPGFRLRVSEQIRTLERITRHDYLKRWSTVSTFLVADAAMRLEMTSAIEAILDADPDTRGRDDFDLPVVTDVFVYDRA